MAEKTKRVKMLHGALGLPPAPDQAPVHLHVGGVYQVPVWFAEQLVGSNFAIETTDALRAGDPASSPGAATCPDCEAPIDPRAKFCGECGAAVSEPKPGKGRRPTVETRDPKIEK